jgi:DNA-binding response OmpR family regulator
MYDMKQVILIAEDEMPLRRAMKKNFEAEGYQVLEAADGEEALNAARKHTADLIVLDIMMPKLNGYDVCRTLRAEDNDIPVIMLTARTAVEDRLDGFDCGADDYLTKPFYIDELFRRVEAVLRRKEPAAEKIVHIGDWEFDFERWTARWGEEPVLFTQRELEMLELLIQRDGKPVSRDDFLDRFWPSESYPTNRTIDTHVLDIRKKLAAGDGLTIETQHRVGYKLIVNKK